MRVQRKLTGETALTIRFPSGLKVTLVTLDKCPMSVSVSWPVWDVRPKKGK